MTTSRYLTIVPFLALAMAPLASAADGADPAATPVATEEPYIGEPVVLTAEQRAERAFRTIQAGLDEKRSTRPEDADVVVCERAATTGSHRTMIHCATNAHWNLVRANSMQRFGGAEGRSLGSGTPKSKKEDSMIVSISSTDFAQLEKRFGKVPATTTAKR